MDAMHPSWDGATAVVRHGIAAFGVGLALLLAACGGDSDGCKYNFPSVFTQERCTELAEEHACNSVRYDADSAVCRTAGCICAARDCDYAYQAPSGAECDFTGEQFLCKDILFDTMQFPPVCELGNCICGEPPSAE